jgi:hypothetical protein
MDTLGQGWGPAHPESDPANMAIKIDAAADHGIDFFMVIDYRFLRLSIASAPPCAALPRPPASLRMSVVAGAGAADQSRWLRARAERPF